MTTLTGGSISVEVRGLAPRQAEAFAHTVLGHSSKETAQAMHISHRTVEVILAQVMQRFNARNRALLIAHAVAKGALIITEQGRAAIFFFAIALSVLAPLDHDDYGRNGPRPVRVRTVRRGNQRDPLEHLFADA
jgi:DNA-binding CsgD family transcriptional regulator